MKKQFAAFFLLMLTITCISAEIEIPRLDKDDIVEMLETSVKKMNSAIIFGKEQVEKDTLLLDTDHVTDEVIYDFLKESLFESKPKLDRFPEILRNHFLSNRDNFIYKDVLYIVNIKQDTLKIFEPEYLDLLEEISYYYISGFNNIRVNRLILSAVGGEWKFCNTDSISFVYENVIKITNWLEEKHPNRIETKTVNDHICKVLTDIHPIRLHLKAINYKNERFRLTIPAGGGFGGLDDKNVYYIYNTGSKDDNFSISNSNFSYLNVDTCRNLEIFNSDIGELSFTANDSINFDNNIFDEVSTYFYPQEVTLKNNVFNSYQNMTRNNFARVKSLILEDNIFTLGLNLDWNVIKQANLDVIPGPHRAERMQRMYSMLKNNLKRMNMLEDADDCHYTSREYLRKNYWKDSDTSIFTRAFKTLFYFVDWVSTGYGTKPLRIFPYALVVILIFAIVYYINPESINNLHEHIEFKDVLRHKLNKISYEELKSKFKDKLEEETKGKHQFIDGILYSLNSREVIKLAGISILKNKLKQFWNCFYFSFSTFTTIGVGDWYPRNSFTKLLVMVEGALGWISLGLFITSYGNLLLR